MSVTVIETENSLYMISEGSERFGTPYYLTVLHGTVMPHMTPFYMESFEAPEVGKSFRANLYMDDTDNWGRFTTSTVKSIIRK